MTERCPYNEKCPIAHQFTGVNLDLLLNRYCDGKSNKCARYQLRQQGKAVPEYLMPWDGLTELEAESSGK
jgi:hypothetical protein